MQCQEGLRWISIETHSIKSSVCARIQDKKAQQSSCKALKLKTKTEDLRQNYIEKKKLWCLCWSAGCGEGEGGNIFISVGPIKLRNK